MAHSTTRGPSRQCSPRAFLAALGMHIRMMGVFKPVYEEVKIAQKTLKHKPADKLYDAFITLLTGARGMVEVNKRLRADPALQRAFGRTACAEQSVIQETLSACTAENVQEMQQALDRILTRLGRACRHNFARGRMLIDVDMQGMTCGRQAEEATKGYYPGHPHQRGRQLARALATDYEEWIGQQLCEGRRQLSTQVIPLMQQVERTLGIEEAPHKRAKILLRMDSGGGTEENVNWALARGYQVLTKEYSASRARAQCARVKEWVADPKSPGRELGWVPAEGAPLYVRPVRRIGVRCKKQDGTWAYAVLISTLSTEEALREAHLSASLLHDPDARLRAYAWAYDLRGGALETENKEDSQGLSLTKRNKKSFTGQQMLVLLAQLAHNVIVWAREWLGAYCPKLQRFGILRMVRDAFTITGWLEMDARGRLQSVCLNREDPMARLLTEALNQLLAKDHVIVILGET